MITFVAVEAINEYITLTIANKKSVEHTCVEVNYVHHKTFLNFCLSGSDCLFDFASTNNFVTIAIDNSYFEKYEEPFEYPIKKQAICCNTQSKLFDIINCKAIGLSRLLYLESIVLFLLYQVQKNDLLFALNCNACSFVKAPIEEQKILLAKEYIVNNLEKNITIPIVASHVGTNQCYLKKGFKEMLGQTMFEFLQENRMVKAKHLLTETQLELADISNAVGYASLSSFSQTYKNYYGIAPSKESKMRIS